MALNKEIQVAMPEHGIAYKKISGKTYVYYVTATYRNEKGKPTCDRSAIGRLARIYRPDICAISKDRIKNCEEVDRGTPEMS